MHNVSDIHWFVFTAQDDLSSASWPHLTSALNAAAKLHREPSSSYVVVINTPGDGAMLQDGDMRGLQGYLLLLFSTKNNLGLSVLIRLDLLLVSLTRLHVEL